METSSKPCTLRDRVWQRFLRAPDNQLLQELYIPALCSAVHYDRCCAYFSSSVLAIAARGFAGLVQNLELNEKTLLKPAIRLLVNEQLDRKDLDALLATGDQSVLTQKLLRRLVTPQEALERDRLGMLAWLVKQGWLEVRVGLMRYTHGLLHAKFGLITDKVGDSLAFSGSDNETGEALVSNYEELNLGTSWEDSAFVEYYRERFDRLWQGQDEQVLTLSLPEAVRLKLIQFAPEKTPRIEPSTNEQSQRVAMLWHFIAAAPYLCQGEYACDATALVSMWPHQQRVVEDTAKAFPAGRLLCDEVGMGKTIEAILILRRLLMGRGVQRALLLVPAGLLRQWQEELREKGGLLVPRWESGVLYAPDGSQELKDAGEALKCSVLLMSREWARLDGNREVLLGAPVWDLVLLDEAHAVRRKSSIETEFNSGNLLLTLLRELQLRRRARGILLMSATPMQTQPWEPWDLLSVLGVGGEWLVEFKDVRDFYVGAAAIRKGELDSDKARVMGKLVVSDSEFPKPPMLLDLADAQSAANSFQQPPLDDEARVAEWLRWGTPLGRRMHRNTRKTLLRYYQRGLLKQPPPKREVEDVYFDFQDPAERACYDSVTGYINRRFDELEKEKSGKGFIMTVYRRRAASSPQALRCSLERRSERLMKVIRREWMNLLVNLSEEDTSSQDLTDLERNDEVDPGVPQNATIATDENNEVKTLLAQLTSLGNNDSKFARFWEALQDVTSDGRSALVFTEYTDTMDYLRDKLRPQYGATLGCYSGEGGQVWDGNGWTLVSKAEIAARLTSGQLRLLVCTDAASEGLNLQAAGALINYDLPWNPSRVEQRIGRIDRIGQLLPVLPVRNLFLQNSVDMKVYEVLEKRCGLFKQFVGPMQPVLADAASILLSKLEAHELETRLNDLVKRADSVKDDAVIAAVFGDSPADDIVKASSAITLHDIEKALVELGSSGRVRARADKKHHIWTITGLRRKSLKVTTDRDTLERDKKVLPITVGSMLINKLVEALPLTGQSPLVIEKYISGPYQCAEVRWICPDKIIEVNSMTRLLKLLKGGITPPPPHLLLQAHTEAIEKAKQRVLEMAQGAVLVEENALEQQVESARLRLMRELGRTLCCVASGSLETAFRTQVKRELSDGYFHRALRCLGDYPTWTPEEREEVVTFYNNLPPRKCEARRAGSEVDAAINDPRWKAKETLADQGKKR